MRRSASEMIRNLDRRIKNLESVNPTPFKRQASDEELAKAISKVVTPLFEKVKGTPFFETPQADIDENTNTICVDQNMVFKLSKHEFQSEMNKFYHRFGELKIPKSKRFKKALNVAIENEVENSRISVGYLGQKQTGVKYRDLAEEYSFTGEVDYKSSSIHVEEVSLSRRGFQIRIKVQQYFKGADALTEYRGDYEDLEY